MAGGNILQLDPMIPVYVPSRKCEGYAFALINYSQEHHVIYGVALDGSGEVWWLANPEIRFCINRTMGRELHDEKSAYSHEK